MAELVALPAFAISVIALATEGLKIADHLFTFVDRWNIASSELKALADDVNFTSNTLSRLGTCLETHPEPRGVHSSWEVQALLDSFQKDAEDVVPVPLGKRDRLKVALSHNKISRLQKKLQALQAKVTFGLEVFRFSEEELRREQKVKDDFRKQRIGRLNLEMKKIELRKLYIEMEEHVSDADDVVTRALIPSRNGIAHGLPIVDGRNRQLLDAYQPNDMDSEEDTLANPTRLSPELVSIIQEPTVSGGVPHEDLMTGVPGPYVEDIDSDSSATTNDALSGTDSILLEEIPESLHDRQPHAEVNNANSIQDQLNQIANMVRVLAKRDVNPTEDGTVPTDSMQEDRSVHPSRDQEAARHQDPDAASFNLQNALILYEDRRIATLPFEEAIQTVSTSTEGLIAQPPGDIVTRHDALHSNGASVDPLSIVVDDSMHGAVSTSLRNSDGQRQDEDNAHADDGPQTLVPNRSGPTSVDVANQGTVMTGPGTTNGAILQSDSSNARSDTPERFSTRSFTRHRRPHAGGSSYGQGNSEDEAWSSVSRPQAKSGPFRRMLRSIFTTKNRALQSVPRVPTPPMARRSHYKPRTSESLLSIHSSDPVATGCLEAWCISSMSRGRRLGSVSRAWRAASMEQLQLTQMDLAWHFTRLESPEGNSEESLWQDMVRLPLGASTKVNEVIRRRNIDERRDRTDWSWALWRLRSDPIEYEARTLRRLFVVLRRISLAKALGSIHYLELEDYVNGFPGATESQETESDNVDERAVASGYDDPFGEKPLFHRTGKPMDEHGPMVFQNGGLPPEIPKEQPIGANSRSVHFTDVPDTISDEALSEKVATDTNDVPWEPVSEAPRVRTGRTKSRKSRDRRSYGTSSEDYSGDYSSSRSYPPYYDKPHRRYDAYDPYSSTGSRSKQSERDYARRLREEDEDARYYDFYDAQSRTVERMRQPKEYNRSGGLIRSGASEGEPQALKSSQNTASVFESDTIISDILDKWTTLGPNIMQQPIARLPALGTVRLTDTRGDSTCNRNSQKRMAIEASSPNTAMAVSLPRSSGADENKHTTRPSGKGDASLPPTDTADDRPKMGDSAAKPSKQTTRTVDPAEAALKAAKQDYLERLKLAQIADGSQTASGAAKYVPSQDFRPGEKTKKQIDKGEALEIAMRETRKATLHAENLLRDRKLDERERILIEREQRLKDQAIKQDDRDEKTEQRSGDKSNGQKVRNVKPQQNIRDDERHPKRRERHAPKPHTDDDQTSIQMSAALHPAKEVEEEVVTATPAV